MKSAKKVEQGPKVNKPVEYNVLDEEIDLFNNRRRLSSMPMENDRRISLGLPDNGRGLTKHYYNVKDKLTKDAMVDLIVRRRSLHQETINLEDLQTSARKRSTIDPDLEERIKRTLAWKEMEDELNKEDVVVQVKKREKQLRKEARKAAPKTRRSGNRFSEERRANLRTGLLETNHRQINTTESIKEAIQVFRAKQTKLVVEPENIIEHEEVKISSDIRDNPRLLLEQLGYLGPREETSKLLDGTSAEESTFETAPSGKSMLSDSGVTKVKKKRRRASTSSPTTSVGSVKGKLSSRSSGIHAHKRSRNKSSSAGDRAKYVKKKRSVSFDKVGKEKVTERKILSEPITASQGVSTKSLPKVSSHSGSKKESHQEKRPTSLEDLISRVYNAERQTQGINALSKKLLETDQVSHIQKFVSEDLKTLAQLNLIEMDQEEQSKASTSAKPKKARNRAMSRGSTKSSRASRILTLPRSIANQHQLQQQQVPRINAVLKNDRNSLRIKLKPVDNSNVLQHRAAHL